MQKLPVIGIPRALFYYKQPYFWQTFFEEMGWPVIISPPTNREILENGCQISEAESCLSCKVLQGHISFLLNPVRNKISNGVDYIFIPRIMSLRKGHLSCPKFFGLPDLAKLLCSDPIKLIDSQDDSQAVILSPTIDFNKESFQKTALKIGWRLTKPRINLFNRLVRGKNIWKIKRAYHKAWQVEEAAQQKKIEEYLHQIKSSQKKVVLISHPYNLYDDFVNLKIKDKLEKLGLVVILIDKVPFEFEPTFTHWDFASEMLNQVKEISQRNITGAVQISTFNCGCDSVIKEFIEAEFKAKKIPYLSLIIDEHSGEAGLITRLEAFVDTINHQ